MQTLNHAWQAYILSIWFFDTGNRVRVAIQIDWNWIFFDSRIEYEIDFRYNTRLFDEGHLLHLFLFSVVLRLTGALNIIVILFSRGIWFYSCKRYFMTFMLIIVHFISDQMLNKIKNQTQIMSISLLELKLPYWLL